MNRTGHRRRRLRLTWLGVLTCLVADLAFADPVRIGLLAFRPAEQMEAEWEPLRAALAAAVPDREFVLVALDYDELDLAVASRRLDFVLTNPGHYVLMLRRYGLSAPLATRINLAQGREIAAFGGVIIVRADQTGIDTLADLSSRRIAFVEKDSLGGFQSQAFELLQIGVRLRPGPRLIEIGLPHDRVVDAVLSGQADAGFLRSGVLEDLISEGRLDAGAVRVVNAQDLPELPFQLSTRLYPEWPFAALPHIDRELSRQVATALLSLRDQPEIRAALGGTSFTVPSNYAPLEELLQALELPPFDVRAPVTFQDLWSDYWLELLAVVLAFIALLSLAGVMLLSARRLRRLLRQVEDLSTIIDRSSVVALSWSTKPGWPVIFVSDSIRRFGYSPEEFVSGQVGFDSLIHPQDVPNIEAEVSQYFAEGPDEYVQEYRFRHGAGHWIWIIDYTWLTRDKHGQVIAVNGVLLDVTERKKAEQQAAHMRELMQYVIEHNKAAVAVHDRDMNYVFVSERYLENHGLAGQNIIGRSHYEVFPDLPQQLREVHARALQGEVLSQDEDVFQQFDGSFDWARWECRPWFDLEGGIGGVVIYIELITERKQAELELKEKSDALEKSNERLQQLASVFTHAREGILITDRNGCIVEVNKAFSRITGYSHDEVMGRNPSLLSSGRHAPEFFAELWKRLERTGYWSGEIWNRRKNGEIYPQAATINAVRDAEGNIVQYVALFTDVSEEKRSERQLEYVSQYDSLTGLPNRKLLTTRLRQAMIDCHRAGSQMAVVFLDLDGFKSINDQFGAEVGDAALSALARRLRDRLGGSETLGRIGGDELVVLLLDLVSCEDARPAIEQLLECVSQPLAVNAQNLQLTASLGVSFYPQVEDVDADQLLRQADQAMYQAKLAGKNRFHLFSPEEDQATRGLHETLQRLRRALENEEFVLHYQPRVNMRTGEVLSAEALIRWQHPERGLLPPAQFLPLLETQTLALDIGQWVIETALKQLVQWREQGLDMTVSVNVFALQLQQPDFIERLRDALAACPDIQSRQLEIEVLETSAMEDIEQVSAVLRECQALGVSCALDDFGTGYSTLSYLKRLPADTLKIDQSFVRDMLDDPDDLAILNGILGLARVFGRATVAEGVETDAHGQVLLDLGCDVGQGYGIARPMKAEDMVEWTKGWRPGPSWLHRRHRNERELQVLFAAVEHRAWISALTRHIEQRGSGPPMSTEDCGFGRWLDQNGELFDQHPDLLKRLHVQHQRVHQVAEEIQSLVSRGQRDQARARVEVLNVERDELLRLLDATSTVFDDSGVH